LLEIKGIVVDTLQKPIPFATVEIIKDVDGIGAAAYQNGEFNLFIPEKLIHDTLTIKALGFETKKIPIQSLNREEYIYIELSATTYDLSEIVIQAGPSTVKEFGNSKISKWTGGLLTKNLTQIAVYIENSKNEHGVLKDISFFISKSGKPKATVRIRVYGFNPIEETIGEDLLHETVIFSPKKRFGWNTIDMSDYNIEFPENGIFIAIEWILTKDKYWYKTIIHGNEYDNYGIVLGNTWEYETSNTYLNNLGQGWRKMEAMFENKPRNALIKATFEIIE
jgi:hypothetical protein